MEKLKNKNSNGITLIALIITIIVMLILVGVTITVALNGGLFNTAQNAATNTMVEAEREQLLSAVVTAYDAETGTISKAKLEANLGTGWSLAEGDTAPYTVTSPKGNKFTVSADGAIDYIGKEEKEEDIDPSTLSDLERYILGADGKGRDLTQIMDVDNMAFKQDPSNLDSEIYKDVKFAYMDEGSPDIQIRYGRDVYKFTYAQTGSGVNTVKKSLTKISTPEGNLGKYVTYQGKNWIVLYDDADKVELISAEALGEVTLGGSDFEAGKTSYNNVITTLTEACETETGISENIRNVGGPAEEATIANVTFEGVKSGENGFTPNADLDEETLAKLKTNIESVKQGDENYLADYNQMKALGILATDTPKYYWMASRLVRGGFSIVSFGMRYICNSDGRLDDSDLCRAYNDGDVRGNSDSNAVRAVVSLSSGILDGKTEEGTRANPINLD